MRNFRSCFIDTSFAANILNNMIALIVSLSLHEAAHAFIAKKQGDRTAELEGRLTLNPIPHMDPVGTLLFPLIGNFIGGGIFGWAKPVPVDLRNLRDPKWSYVLVAAAGPAANLLLCTLSIFVYFMLQINFGPPVEGSASIALYRLSESMVRVNAVLAFFNLIPLAPLDGSTIFTAFLPDNLNELYEKYIAPYGMMILIVLMFTGGLTWVWQLASGYIAFSQRLVGLLL